MIKIFCLFLLMGFSFFARSSARAQDAPSDQSRGLLLFDQGNYKDAIDSLKMEINRSFSGHGIRYYYIGASYYNLGLSRQNNSVADFDSAVNNFKKAIPQTDILGDYVPSAVYKSGWCSFRIAEITNEPADFQEAASFFKDADGEFRLAGKFMAGESHLRSAELFTLKRNREDAHSTRLRVFSDQTTLNINHAKEYFDSVYNDPSSSDALKFYSELKKKDAEFLSALFFQDSPEAVNQINYDSSMPGARDRYQSLIQLGNIYRDFRYYLELNVRDSALLEALKREIGQLTENSYQSEKRFIAQFADFKTVEIENLNQINFNFDFTEALYWQGWLYFIADRNSESKKSFERFINETAGIENDLRIQYLRDEATQRVYFIEFFENIASTSALSQLSDEVGRFHTKFSAVRDDVEIIKLLILAAAGSGEQDASRRRQIFARLGGTPEERLTNMFHIKELALQRANIESGVRRGVYLNIINSLQEFTRLQYAERTSFYEGLRSLLHAETQTGSARIQRFNQVAERFRRIGAIYEKEARYIQAMCYHRAAVQASGSQAEEFNNRAKVIFERLVRENKSLRSLYYLARVHHAENNYSLAAKYYKTIIDYFEKEPSGQTSDAGLWIDNAKAAFADEQIKNSYNSAVADPMNINIDSIMYPDSLLVIDGRWISAEYIVEPRYIKYRYRDTALDIFKKFGLPKPHLYPSRNRLNGSYLLDRAFPYPRDYDEITYSIESGLSLRIFPEVPDARVTVNDEPLDRAKDGSYEKTGMNFGETVKIIVKAEGFHPAVKEFRLVIPPITRRSIELLEKRIIDEPEMIPPPDNFIHINRLDSAGFFYSGQRMPGAGLRRDFQNDIRLRDFVFSQSRNGYFAIQSEKPFLVSYTSGGEKSDTDTLFPEDLFNSPEGISVDSKGNFYIADWGGHKIVILDQEGKHIRSIGGFGENIHSEADSESKVKLAYPTKCLVIEDAIGNGPTYLIIADHHGIHETDEFGNYWRSYRPRGMPPGTSISIFAEGYGRNMNLRVFNRVKKEFFRIVYID